MYMSTWMMILKMTGSALMYTVVTTLAYLYWRKREKTLWLKILVGLVYGLCCVASNHLGVEYNAMVINVRDIGPLAAGLFFDPLSGILAGLIGGIERYLIGEFLGIGAFTRVACGISTCLAGFLAAALHRRVYCGERPSVVHACMVGAVMEVFHMYAVMLTNRDNMNMAHIVVSSCSIPMIVFTAVGMAVCSLIVFRLSSTYHGTAFFQPRAKTPVFVHFQRWLLIVTVVLFVSSTLVGYLIQVRIAVESARMDMEIMGRELRIRYDQNGHDLEALRHYIGDLSVSWDKLAYVVDSETGEYMINGIAERAKRVSDSDLRLIMERADAAPFFAELKMVMMQSYTMSIRLDERYYLVLCATTYSLSSNGETQLYDTIFSNILIFAILFFLVSQLVETMVVRNLKSVNQSLNRITEGQLNEEVAVRSSLEFSELSDDINQTVTVLKGYIEEARRRMQADLKLAADIQEASLPRNFTYNRSDFEIYAMMVPAKEVGGDFYDFFFIDNNTMVLVIADVSGKSVPAALFMMRSKTAIKNYARSGNSPAELLTHVNNTLCEGNDAEMFVTVWLGIIDLRTGRMRCANAGHEYPILMRTGGKYKLIKDRHGMVLAAVEDVPMIEYELELNPGDRLFVYTDGIPEAINEKEEAYGTGRLVEKLNTLRDAAQRETLAGVIGDVRAFAGKAEQFDDITMIGFTYLGGEAG